MSAEDRPKSGEVWIRKNDGARILVVQLKPPGSKNPDRVMYKLEGPWVDTAECPLLAWPSRFRRPA